MIKIKDKVNKTEVFKELTEIGKKRFEFTCEPDEDLKVFLDGAEQLFKLLRLTDVIVPKGTLSDFEKWLDKKENETYCELPSQYVLDKYKSLNAL